MEIKDILIYYIGLVILMSATHRLFLNDNRKEEIINMNLPSFVEYFIIIFEFVCGILLITNYKYKINVLYCILTIMVIGSILIFINNIDNILQTYNDVFTYKPTYTSFVLHITYIVIIGSIIYY
jgi:uncharacterized membrane protein YphA (DoxX/SURF4 family)